MFSHFGFIFFPEKLCNSYSLMSCPSPPVFSFFSPHTECTFYLIEVEYFCIWRVEWDHYWPVNKNHAFYQGGKSWVAFPTSFKLTAQSVTVCLDSSPWIWVVMQVKYLSPDCDSLSVLVIAESVYPKVDGLGYILYIQPSENIILSTSLL